MKNILVSSILTLLLVTQVQAQKEKFEKVEIDGQLLTQMITPEGDTILVGDLEDVTITSPRSFDSREDYLLYMKYRRYAVKVYPYAKDAIRIFKEVDYATREMKDRERKKYIKQLSKELKEEFEDPLKNLTKTQGRILITMIERHLDTPMYDLIKGLRGGVSASYWSTTGRFFGYRLKEGYIEGEDPILDAVLQDFDVSYRF